MADVSLANVSNALQKVILPYIQDNFPKQKPLLDQLKRNADVTFFNDNFYAPVRTGRHGGITNLATDAGSLVSSNASIGQASVGYKVLTGTFKITKAVLDATKTTKGAVENQLTFQANSLMDDFAKDVNRQLYSDGLGVVGQVLGSVGAGTASLTQPDSSLDDGRGTAERFGSINGDIAVNKYIQIGNILGIGTAAADVGTVTSVGGTSIVMTGAPAIVANDTIYRLDGDAAGAGTSEVGGLMDALSILTSGTYAGIANSTFGWSPQLGTSSAALTLSEMESNYLAGLEYAQSGDKYAIFVNKTLYKKYGDILTSMRRTVDTKKLLGGWSGLAFEVGAGEVGVFLDYDVPDGEVYILNLDSFTICQISDMGWAEDPSGGALIRSRGTLLYEATMHWFMNLLCRAPAANARLVRKTA